MQEPAGQVDLIPELQGADGADLVLPLTGEHLRVDARDVEAGLHACLQVSLGQGAAKGRLGSDTAVEGALNVVADIGGFGLEALNTG